MPESPADRRHRLGQPGGVRSVGTEEDGTPASGVAVSFGPDAGQHSPPIDEVARESRDDGEVTHVGAVAERVVAVDPGEQVEGMVGVNEECGHPPQAELRLGRRLRMRHLGRRCGGGGCARQAQREVGRLAVLDGKDVRQVGCRCRERMGSHARTAGGADGKGCILGPERERGVVPRGVNDEHTAPSSSRASTETLPAPACLRARQPRVEPSSMPRMKWRCRNR